MLATLFDTMVAVQVGGLRSRALLHKAPHCHPYAPRAPFRPCLCVHAL